MTHLDAVFEHAEVVGVGEFDDFQFVVFLHVFDPFIGLTLRVDNQRPAVCACAY